jgi:hypothetical protein
MNFEIETYNQYKQEIQSLSYLFTYQKHKKPKAKMLND